MTVSVPAEWEVAANGSGRQTAPGRWEFDPTQPLATYFVSVIAGPDHVRRDEHDGIPLAIYCRRGLAPHLDKDLDEIFDVTKACLDRYHELFGVRYPFGKYDQAFLPEFNAGAMEGAGLITFRDEFIFRSAVADDEREERVQAIAHEMAHMWFGDLVTMRWWDDLWLNESFAEYMGYLVTAAQGFWSARHGEVTRSYVRRYFDEAPAMAARRSPAVAIDVAEGAYPRFAVDPQTVALAEGLIARTDVSPGLRRAVVDYTDDLRRALAGRTLERS
jgi:aminopeptidase N